MPTNKPKRIKVILDCEHDRWFEPDFMPHVDTPIWCPKCETYVPIQGADFGEVLNDGVWTSNKVRGGYEGKCTECAYTMKRSSFARVRLILEGHYTREHAKSSLAPTFDYANIPSSRLPPNSPPPF